MKNINVNFSNTQYVPTCPTTDTHDSHVGTDVFHKKVQLTFFVNYVDEVNYKDKIKTNFKHMKRYLYKINIKNKIKT